MTDDRLTHIPGSRNSAAAVRPRRNPAEVLSLISMVKSYVNAEQQAGIDFFEGCPRPVSLVPRRVPGKQERLNELCGHVSRCNGCGLREARKNAVFGMGNPEAELVFVGEAPGADEDMQGLPFVGKAGEMLEAILNKGMGLTREQVYICNVVKCRPPQNRSPQPEEVGACRHFLEKQLEILDPKVICALGKYAAQCLTGIEDSITKLRGKFCSYRGIALMPTFHPAYLLRNPGDKKLVWEDLKQVMSRLSLKPRSAKRT